VETWEKEREKRREGERERGKEKIKERERGKRIERKAESRKIRLGPKNTSVPLKRSNDDARKQAPHPINQMGISELHSKLEAKVISIIFLAFKLV
jgi:hypothetical protein